MRATRTISISLPPAQLRTVERIARKENRTMSELVREALRQYERMLTPAPANLAEAVRLLRKIPGKRALTNGRHVTLAQRLKRFAAPAAEKPVLQPHDSCRSAYPIF